jgi:hypothetical protein
VVRPKASVVRVGCEVETWELRIEMKLIHIDGSGGVDNRLVVIDLHHVYLVVLALRSRCLFLDDGFVGGGARRRTGLLLRLLFGLTEDVLETIWAHVVELGRIFPVSVDEIGMRANPGGSQYHAADASCGECNIPRLRAWRWSRGRNAFEERTLEIVSTYCLVCFWDNNNSTSGHG